MEAQDLEFFEEFIDSYQDEYDVGFRRIAATLVYLLQKEKPLQPEGPAEMPEIEEATAPRPAKSAGGSGNAGMKRFRIEVGRVHGVEPRHIVGAITNEAQISSGDIGAIKLFHEFSLVDLPAKMPQETFSLLQDVWVCGRQLKLSVDTGPGDARQEQHPGKRTFGKGGPSRFKPSGKKPPHTRRGK
jgi:ATP-dependent RNA helicase DeaD